MAQKGRGKSKGPELLFDDKARAEYLTGFRKRKQERKQAGREYLAKKAKEEQLVARKELREARRQKAAENVREQRKAFGLEAEGESDLDAAANSDDEAHDDDSDVVPQIQEESYDSDEHHTHVVVESFDPELEAFDKATATKSAALVKKPKANGASTAAAPSVEALPPSSRRVNKAKANASLSFPPPLFVEPRFLSRPRGYPPSTFPELTLCSSSLVSPTTGQGQETSDSHQEKDVTQKRLHISGLTESFSKEDLIRRFSTFGTVVALDGLGKRDALGQFRPYAYLTLQASTHQIKRCMNLLSGSVWKGATLRIGEARPDYQQRIQLEKDKWGQEQKDRDNKPKKFKRLPPGMGVECSSMEPIDKEAVESGLERGWKLTPAGHLVRPLRMRPSHPLPRPSRASTLARINANADEDAEEQKQSIRRARINPRPPTKAHRITIDPTRYGAVHLSGPLLESLATETDSPTHAFDVSSLGSGQWQCEEIYDDEETGTEQTPRLVRWQYIANSGKILHEEFTKLPVRVVPSVKAESAGDHEDDVMAQLDFDRCSDTESNDNLFSGFPSSINAGDPHTEPGRPSTSQVAPPLLEKDVFDTADNDVLFKDLRTATVPATNINDLFSDFPSTTAPTLPNKRPKVDNATRMPKPSKKGTFVPGLDPEEEDPASFSDGYEEGAATGLARDSKEVVGAEEEKKRTLALLGEMFGSGLVDATAAKPTIVNLDMDDEARQDEELNPQSFASESSSGSNSASEADEVETTEENSTSSSSLDSESSVAEEGLADEGSADELLEMVASEKHAEIGAEDLSMADAPDPAAETPGAPNDRKSRRAAFLLSLSSSSVPNAEQTGSYVPIARFDPGVSASVAIDESNPVHDGPRPVPSTYSDQSSSPAQGAEADAQGTKVSVSTLKEMFKPQDRPSNSGITVGFSLGLGAGKDERGTDTGNGFSLMDSLGLEFELEEEEPEPEAGTVFAPALYSNIGYSRFQQAAAPQDQEDAQQQRPGLFFPSSSSSSSWNSGDNQGSVQRWLKPRSEEEKEKDWAKYKEELTQVIKKRHREAARKHKRNFKSLPQPQQQHWPGASVHAGTANVGTLTRT